MKNVIPRPNLPRRGILTRSLTVRIAELSRTGCRLEANEPFTIGEFGMLTVEIDGERYMEMFRVARVTPAEASSQLFVAGVEFLPLPGDAPSLQDVIVQIEADSPAWSW